MSNPRLIGALAGAVALLLAGTSEADAARRVALVIGNDLYDHAPALGNARADAEALADRLEGLGFELFLGGDLDRGGMETLLRGFARAAQGAELALAFYAGHGLQVEEENWLLPVDARLESLLDLEYEAVPLALLLRALQGAETRLLLLDACRDNPLAEEMALPAGSGGLRRGLARVERAEHGTLIAFATSPGAVAADGPAEGAAEGTGGHSPFAAALLRHLDEPGLELRELLTRVRREVRRATGGRQTPWEHSSLVGEVYLAGTVAGGTTRSAVALPPAAPVGPASSVFELAAWDAIKDSGLPEDFTLFLRQFPDSPLAPFARQRRERLRDAAREAETGREAAPAALEPRAGLYRIAAPNGANLRAGPGTDRPILATLARGTQVQVTGKLADADWYRLERPEGEAYVFGTLIVPEAAWRQARRQPGQQAPAAPRPAAGSESNPVEAFVGDFFSGFLRNLGERAGEGAADAMFDFGK